MATESLERVSPHFLNLMGNGKRRGASYSEKGCFALATEIRKYVTSLDSTAIQGLHDWIDFCRLHPAEAKDILDVPPRAK